MSYAIAVFTSRNETLYYMNLLRQSGIFASIINTPKEAGQTCGISVKFDSKMINYARSLLKSRPFRAFYGFFLIKEISFSRKVMERI